MSKVYVIATICQNKKKIDKKIETNNYPPPLKKHKQTNEQKKKQKTPQKREQNSQNLIFS